MYKLISSILLCSAISTQSFAATEKANYGGKSSKQETTGLVGGVLIGALAGGPPGAIAGGALGALFGEGWRAKGELDKTKLVLAKNKLELTKAKQESEKANGLYLAAKRQLLQINGGSPTAINVGYNQDALPNCCADTSLSVHFRTGSNLIEGHYQDQLAGIAKLANALPGSRLEIVGYADRKGEASANLKLSKQRTDAVRVFFNTLGFPNSDITTIAYGESRPIDESESVESDFFDRRVVVRLRDSNDQLVTTESPSR